MPAEAEPDEDGLTPLMHARFSRRNEQVSKLRRGVFDFASLVAESRSILGEADTQHIVETSWLSYLFAGDAPGIITEAETRRLDSGVRRVPLGSNPGAHNQHAAKRRKTLLDPKLVSLIVRYSHGRYERQGQRE